MRYPYIVAAGCLTLLLSSPAVAGTTIDPASAPSSTAQLASDEVPLPKSGGQGHKRHHHKKDKKDKEDKEGQGQGPTGNQIPFPGEDYPDPGLDTPAPTPEPGTMLLLGAAAGAMGLRRRMRNRSR